MTDRELFELAEKYYLGQVSTFEVVSLVRDPADLCQFKKILVAGMRNTALALCDEVDKGAALLAEASDSVGSLYAARQ